MGFRFEELEIWNLSIDYADNVCEYVASFPKVEIYGLSQQLRRAAFSVSLNIAEGCGRRSKKDFSHFLDIARGSVFEVVTGFHIALKRNYISKEAHDNLYKKSTILAKKIGAFQKTLR